MVGHSWFTPPIVRPDGLRKVVGRLTALPQPGADRTWYDKCNGRPLNRHTESWEQDGLFWVRTEFTTLAGCLPR